MTYKILDLGNNDSIINSFNAEDSNVLLAMSCFRQQRLMDNSDLIADSMSLDNLTSERKLQHGKIKLGQNSTSLLT